ncbi:MAG: 16S rRNA processing protein RimM [Clostridia bacterium]|nr:16S rRNA processing protein RimM [Clostridia bacterium]
MLKEYLEAGKIVGTFGVLGEVRILPWSDSPDFLRGFSRVFIDGKEYKLLRTRVHKGMALALIEGFANPEDAMVLKNKTVMIARADAALPEGRVFVEDLIGLPVFDLRRGRVIGKLAEVMNLPAGDVYRVAGEKGDILIPAVPAFLRGADPEKGEIRVETIEGMGDED